MKSEKLHLIGYASGLGGADINCGQGPSYLKSSALFKASPPYQYCDWDSIIEPTHNAATLDQTIANLCQALASRVKKCMEEDKNFSVIGGDHSGAIGTWSAVASLLKPQGDLGLIWIDAHMDSHTHQTSVSQRIHGMPLAALLGYGLPSLTQLLNFTPKIKPENIFLIGVRSFEKDEEKFLRNLNIKFYTMQDVLHSGFKSILQEIVKDLRNRTVGYGISFDLDSIDPNEAPGVDVPEPNGLHVNDVFAGFKQIIADPKLVSIEIMEFDPLKDIAHKTENIIIQLLEIIHQKSPFKLYENFVS